MTGGQKQSGFTLVEVVIVLAISGLALSMFLLGQGRQQRNQQFSHQADQVRAAIASVQSEATSGVINPGVVRGKDADRELLGKFIIIAPGLNYFRTGSILIKPSTNQIEYDPALASAPKTFLPQGISFKACDPSFTWPECDDFMIVYTAHPEKMYATNDTFRNGSETDISDYSPMTYPNYSGTKMLQNRAIYLTDDEGRLAKFEVNPASRTIVRTVP